MLIINILSVDVPNGSLSTASNGPSCDSLNSNQTPAYTVTPIPRPSSKNTK